MKPFHFAVSQAGTIEKPANERVGVGDVVSDNIDRLWIPDDWPWLLCIRVSFCMIYQLVPLRFNNTPVSMHKDRKIARATFGIMDA